MKALVPQCARLHPTRHDLAKQSVRAEPDASAPAPTAAFQRARVAFCVLFLWAGSVVRAGESPFAEQVLEYLPAPGFWVQDSSLNNPGAALGAPDGAGLLSGAAPDLVTLGGFGGTITLGFDHTVEDDPLNPFGMDAIVFGNAFWLGFSISDADPNRRWAECATIEIALDANGNNRPDGDEWFLIPGSHLAGSPLTRTTVVWDTDTADPTHPPADSSWIPRWVPDGFPGPWQSAAFALPLDVFGQPVVVNPDTGGEWEGIFGYGDYTPTLLLGDLDADDVVEDASISAEDFYTVPDDPGRVGISPAAGGGDAFDIAWAIDPATGEPANLPGFDFIRITNGVDRVFGEEFTDVFEMSPEVDGVSDVAPDPFGDFDADGDIDLFDVAGLMNCAALPEVSGPPCDRVDREPSQVIDLMDLSAQVSRLTGPLP